VSVRYGAGMLYRIAGLGVTLPTWLVAEGFAVYAALTWFDQGVIDVGYLLVAAVLFSVGLVALAAGYMLRDVV
jgi:hypothetical protein